MCARKQAEGYAAMEGECGAPHVKITGSTISLCWRHALAPYQYRKQSEYAAMTPQDKRQLWLWPH